MKRRLKRKVIWFNEWNIREQEAWFSEMALEGWELIKVGQLFATFAEASPQEVIYRYGQSIVDDAHREKIELYRKSGWKFIGSRNKLSVYRKVENEEPPEVYLSPVDRTKTISHLQESFKKKSVLAIISSIFLIILNIWSLRINPVDNFLYDSMILSSYTIIASTFVILHMMNGMIHISKLANQFLVEEVEPGFISYQGVMARKKFIAIIAAVLILIMIVSIIKMLTLNQVREEDVLREDLPILQISDILDEVDLKQKTTGNLEDHYDVNVNSSILVPEQYEFYQNVSEIDDNGKNISIRSHYYEGLNEWIAEGLAQALVKRYSEFQPVYKPLSHEYFDELWIGKSRINVAFIVRKGKVVYNFQYNGNSLDGNQEMDILLKIEERL